MWLGVGLSIVLAEQDAGWLAPRNAHSVRATAANRSLEPCMRHVGPSALTRVAALNPVLHSHTSITRFSLCLFALSQQ